MHECRAKYKLKQHFSLQFVNASAYVLFLLVAMIIDNLKWDHELMIIHCVIVMHDVDVRFRSY